MHSTLVRLSSATLALLALGVSHVAAGDSPSLGKRIAQLMDPADHSALLAPAPGLVEPCGAVVIDEAPPVWFFTAGVAVRSVDAAFNLDGSKVSRNFTPYRGKGNVGIFRIGADTIHYDDGYVTKHDHPFLEARAASALVENESQVSDHPVGIGSGFQNSIVSFHTESFSYSARNNYQSSGSDSDAGVGPYIQLGRQLGASSGIFNFVTSWTFVNTDHEFGPQTLATLVADRTLYTYEYDHVTNPAEPQFLPGYVGGMQEFLPIHPNLIFGGLPAGIRGPRQFEEDSTLLAYRAVASSTLDVNLNEIAFGLERGCQQGPVQLLVTGGLTLNVIDYELNSTVAWYDRSGNRVSTYLNGQDSGSPIKVGLYGGLVARCDLSKDGRFYLESSGTYRWVDSVTASTGVASVEIDPSSWEGRFGFGIRF